MEPTCIFCRIVEGRVPSTRVYEDELCLAFRDLHPQAPVHVLIIPKTEIPSVAQVEPEHEATLGRLFTVARKLGEEFGLSDGYRLVVNCGKDGGQTVDHLHVHLLGQRALAWPPG